VLSQNVQLFTFLQPVPFLLVTLTYGVPVLVIRELSVARELDEVGLVVLGLAYGILNEGVLAKTLTLPDGAPLHDFAGYGRVGPDPGRLVGLHHRLARAAQRPLSDSADAMDVSRGRGTTVVRRRGVRAGCLYVLLVLLAGLYALYFLNPERNDPAVFVLYAS
jgi:hypothetical protein